MSGGRMRCCYVYAIIVDDVIRYIGKGTGRRAQQHISYAKYINQCRASGRKVKALKFHNRLAKAIKNGSSVAVQMISTRLSTKAAFTREIEEIAVHGKRLWNELPGGQGADTNHFKRNWQNGRHIYLKIFRNKDHRRRISERVAIQWADEAARDRNRKRTTRQWKDPAFRAARVAAINAADTPARRRRLSVSAKRAWANSEIRTKQIEAIRAACSTEEFREKQRARWRS